MIYFMIDRNNIDLKKEIKTLKKLSGEERGMDIKYLVHRVTEKEGNRGLKRVISELKKNGYKFPDLSKIGNMDWISVSLPTIFLVASVKCFGWQEKDIIQMGREVLLFSYTIKIFIKYFLSIEKTFKIAARNWKKYYSKGELSIKYDNKKANEIVIYLKNFKKHPYNCLYLTGLFSKLIEIITGERVIKAVETKCPFRGDSYHEFKIYWK